MLPNLTLDVKNEQIRIGDKVCWGADNGSYLFFGEVYKITPCFVWMRELKGNYNFRRESRRVCVIKSKES